MANKTRRRQRQGEKRWQQTLLPSFQSMVTMVTRVISILVLLTVSIHFQATFCVFFVVVFSTPLCSNSPLKAELVPKTAAKQQQQKKALQKGQFCLAVFLSVFTSS